MKANKAFSVFILFLIPAISWAENLNMEKARKARNLAEQAIVDGRFCDAAFELVRVYNFSNNRDALFNAGVAAERAEDLELALRLFQKFAEKAPLSSQRPAALERVEVLWKKIKAGESAVICQRKVQETAQEREDAALTEKEISMLQENQKDGAETPGLQESEFTEAGALSSGPFFDPEIIIRAGLSGHAGVLGIAGEIRPLPWMGIALGTGTYLVGGGLTFGGPAWKGLYIDAHTVLLKPTPIGGNSNSQGLGIGVTTGLDIRIMDGLRLKLGGGAGWKRQTKEKRPGLVIDATLSPVIRRGSR